MEIRMLGKFKMLSGDRDVIETLGSSKKKTALLAYLILSRGRAVSLDELYGVIWPNEPKNRLESALKALISRLRTDLDGFGLKKSITTTRGSYTWTLSPDDTADVWELEAQCARLQEHNSLTGTEGGFRRVLELYAGELLEGFALGSWVSTKSRYFCSMFTQTAARYAFLLINEGRNDEAARVCRRGLEADASSPALNLHLITALLRLSRPEEAMIQYNLTKGSDPAASDKPPGELLAFYEMLVRIEKSSNDAIEDIRREFQDEDKEPGAFLCDYPVFKEIYRLNMRNLARTGTPVFIAVISVDTIGPSGDFMVFEKVMGLLRDALRRKLRRGDAVARYSTRQYALLLPSVNHQTGHEVLERIKREFYLVCPSSRFVMDFTLRPINREEEAARA